jgi:hypothetical protein
VYEITSGPSKLASRRPVDGCIGNENGWVRFFWRRSNLVPLGQWRQTVCALYFTALDTSSDNLSNVFLSERNVISFDAKILTGALYGIYVDLCMNDCISVPSTWPTGGTIDDIVSQFISSITDTDSKFIFISLLWLLWLLQGWNKVYFGRNLIKLSNPRCDIQQPFYSLSSYLNFKTS